MLDNSEYHEVMKENSKNPLHLSGLSIQGFRGVQGLEIPNLGRVTLIAGENGIGKTTVLEAVRLYASRGRENVLFALLNKHEEISEAADEDGNRGMAHNIATLFNGRKVSDDSEIKIGPYGNSENNKLKIVLEYPDKKDIADLKMMHNLPFYGTNWPVVKVSFSNYFYRIPLSSIQNINLKPVRELRTYRRFIDDHDGPPLGLNFQTLGPGLMNNDQLAEFWDKVALTDAEDRAITGLNLVLADSVNRVTVIGDNRRPYGRRIIVKLGGVNEPVPLRSLGDGAVRVFSLALALVCSQDGFLVIDEAENGIHHLVLESFWRMVLQTANENNVQVLATTHSSDCVRGFAKAAVSFPEIDGALVRLERQNNRMRAVVYSESKLNIAVDQGIEVR